MAECGVSAAVRRARRLRPLNAFITELFDEAEQRAQRLRHVDEHRRRQYAPVADVDTPADRRVFPIAVKDCFSTRNVVTSCGSRMLANYVPSFDATPVARLLRAGGVMLGKTNMDEYSMGTTTSTGCFGPAKNPYTLLARPSIDLNDDWLVAGGSSGGSAIAVACHMAKVALGSDTGGSTRNPAALCGVVGLKPTYGLVSRHGLIPLVNSLDCPAIITRDVQDCAWALDLVSGRDQLDSTSVDRPLASFQNYATSRSAVSKLRIGIPREYYHASLSAAGWRAWNAAAAALQRHAGCTVVPVSMAHTHWSILCYHVLGECDVASNMARYDGVEFGHRSRAAGSTHSVDALYALSRAEGFNEVVRRRILAGNYFLLTERRDDYFERAAKIRRLIADDHYRLFRADDSPVDVLLTPAASDACTEASRFVDESGYERERLDDFYTQPANMAGVPALVLPTTRTSDGRPLAVQLVADHFQEAKLFTVAHWLQEYFQFEPLCVDKVIHRLARFA